MDGVRIDKWLWAARFFKTRSLAKRACDLGRVEANRQKAKASHEVRIRDLIVVKNASGDFEIEVLGLSEIRGAAETARVLYRETERSRESRAKIAAERKAMPQFYAPSRGKPSKRDRRALGRLRRGAD